jgi:hypothetical protein
MTHARRDECRLGHLHHRVAERREQEPDQIDTAA